MPRKKSVTAKVSKTISTYIPIENENLLREKLSELPLQPKPSTFIRTFISYVIKTDSKMLRALWLNIIDHS